MKRLFQKYRQWRKYCSTVRELNKFTNKELFDIGIIRGDIPLIAKHLK